MNRQVALPAIACTLLALTVPAFNVAHAQEPPRAPASAAEVYTRAVVRSITNEGGNLYIRLKLVPKAKLPFSTLTYRVLDPKLVAGLREGDSVAFRAERAGGENVLTAIRTAPPCQRFEECK